MSHRIDQASHQDEEQQHGKYEVLSGTGTLLLQRYGETMMLHRKI